MEKQTDNSQETTPNAPQHLSFWQDLRNIRIWPSIARLFLGLAVMYVIGHIPSPFGFVLGFSMFCGSLLAYNLSLVFTKPRPTARTIRNTSIVALALAVVLVFVVVALDQLWIADLLFYLVVWWVIGDGIVRLYSYLWKKSED